MKKPSVTRSPFITDDPQAACEHFRLAAEALPDAEVQVFHVSAVETHKAVRAAVQAVIPELGLIAERAPGMDIVALQELPTLSLAVIYAASRVPAPTPSEGLIAAKLDAIAGPRERTLSFLEVCAGEGIVPRERVRGIRAGKGALDKARDAVALAGVFAEFHDALEGRHPFDEATLRAMADDGAWLINAMTESAARGQSPEAKLRDRLGTLLARGCDQLRVAGAVAWGDAGMRRRIKGLLKNRPPRVKDPTKRKP